MHKFTAANNFKKVIKSHNPKVQMKFLIVDDNEKFRSYLREFITGKNDKCVELDDGINVASAFREFKPDLVLLDIVMKKVNGFSAAEKLKKEFPEARIVFVSDYTDKYFKKKAETLGVEGFVPKENLYELKEIIQQHKKQLMNY